MNRKKEKSDNAKKRSRILVFLLKPQDPEIGDKIRNTNICSRIYFAIFFWRDSKYLQHGRNPHTSHLGVLATQT